MLNMNKEKEIIYISENIDLVENTIEIINYIKHHKINFSQNSNGLFLNLTLLEDEHILSISEAIKKSLKINFSEESIAIPNKNNKIKEEKIYKPLKITNIQREIIDAVF
jgi:hypothetical protein